MNGDPPNPYKDIKNKTKHEWHAYWVFEDKDFQKHAKDIIEAIDDPPYIEDIDSETIREQLLGSLEHLIEDFNITLNDWNKYMGGDSRNVFPERGEYIGLERRLTREGYITEVIHLKFMPGLNRKNYIAAWDYIKNELETERLLNSKRDRPPDDTRLIYAIYRSRKSGKRYSTIFGEYQNGSLPYYDGGPTNQFASVELLSRYYNKYRPDR